MEPELKRLKSEQRLVKDAVSLLSQRCDQLAELNSTSPYVVGKKAHKPDQREKELPPVAWIGAHNVDGGMQRHDSLDQPQHMSCAANAFKTKAAT